VPLEEEEEYMIKLVHLLVGNTRWIPVKFLDTLSLQLSFNYRKFWNARNVFKQEAVMIFCHLHCAVKPYNCQGRYVPRPQEVMQ
jgi:hypothetical protein